MPTITETGNNGQDGWGTGIFGGDVNPVLPAGADGTAGAAADLALTDQTLAEYTHVEARGGRGGHAGFGASGSPPPIGSNAPGVDGGDGGNGASAGSASSVIDDVSTAYSVRASAWGGQGGHGGYGGNGGTGDGAGNPGGSGGDGGNGAAGGNALARVSNIDQVFDAFGYFEIVAQAGAGQGGFGGFGGNGAPGTGPGGAGSPGFGGVGGNATAEAIGNHITLPGGNVSIGAYANAGNGGSGGYGAISGSTPATSTSGRPGAAAGTATATISGNVVTAGDLANVVTLTATIGQALGGTGGLSGSGATRAASGANGTGVLTMTGNTVSLGGGDDQLTIDIVAFQGTTVLFSDNSFDGGAGADTLTVSARFINEAGQTVSNIALDLATGFGGFERVFGGAYGDHIIASDSGATIDGADGDDRLYGRLGADHLLGGLGNDLLAGGLGNDVLEGGLNDDTLTGGDGDDVLTGGFGNDLIDGGIGNDVADYAASAERVRVSLAKTDAQNTVGSGVDRLVGVENLIGSAFADKLVGNAVANVLTGGAGDDTLDGGVDADTLRGGAGNDVYFVDDLGDTVVELAGEGIDRVTSTVDFVLGADVENLGLRGSAQFGTGNGLDNAMLGSSGKNTLTGLAGADTLDGGTGFDTLDGGDGNDILTGGIGKDRLTGGAGLDQFVFRDGDSSVDRALADVITDFSHAQADRIKLSAMDANVGLAGDQKFAFIETSAFTGVAGQLHYVLDGGNTYVEGDANGDGLADFAIRLNGVINLVASDFVL